MRGDYEGDTPLAYARKFNTDRANHAAVVRCLEENTRNFPALLNQITVKLCMVEMKSQGMTQVVSNVPVNNLPPTQFVFKLFDEMVNREMRLLAEEIISYVGTNIGL